MATFKAMNVAAQLANDLSLRLQGQGSSGANITVTNTTITVGSGPGSVQPAVLIGTQASGSNSNSASLILLPEQLNLTTGVASNVWNNSIGNAQEVYTPHQLLMGFENYHTSNNTIWTNEAARLQVIGDCIGTGMRVTLVLTTAGTAPTPANVLAATQLSPSFVIDQYNPLTNQS